MPAATASDNAAKVGTVTRPILRPYMESLGPLVVMELIEYTYRNVG